MTQERLTKKSTRFRGRRLLLAIFGTSLLLTACNQLNLLSTLGTQGEGGPLSLEPSTATVVKNGTLAFVARGGDMPYRFELVSGLGRINSDSGVYTAPSVSPSTAIIRVLDDSGASQSASITVTGTTSGLAISPAVVTVPPGGQVSFIASGGSGSYAFSLTATGSGAPTLGTSSGVYVAGNNTGTDLDTVRVSDGTNTADGLITIQNATTNVDYAVGALALPPSGTAGQSLTVSAAFAITNLGASNGADPVFWYVYLSEDGTLGSGDYLVDQGSVAGIEAAPSPNNVDIDISGQWPSFTGGANFFVRIFAQDDSDYLAGANEASDVTTVNAPDIDYAVTAVTHSGGSVSGGSFSGGFTIENIGTSNGSDTVYWTAYVSGDTTLGSDDLVVDTGTTAALPSSSSIPLSFSGTWPTEPPPPVDLYLIVEVINGEDTTGTNDWAASGAVSIVPGDVQNAADAPVVTGGSNAATEAFTGTFDIHNYGSADGLRAIYWNAYISEAPALDGSDTLIDSGSTGPLPGGGGSTTVNVAGYWPGTPGSNYYLIAEISSTDTVIVPTAVSGPYVVVAAGVDYQPSNVAIGSAGPNPGDAINGTFDLANIGSSDGVQTVTWAAYASKDTTLGPGDSLITAGTSPFLGAGVGPVSIPYAGQNPLQYGTYYVLVETTAGDDLVAGNNVTASMGTFTCGVYDEVASEPNDSIGTALMTGVTFEPGMEIRINGNTTSPGGDSLDTIGFNVGTANSLRFAWYSDVAVDLDLYLYDAAYTVLAVENAAEVVQLVALEWVVDAASVGTIRYLEAENWTVSPAIGDYRLIITAD